MIERELGRGWFLQSWPDNTAAPRLHNGRHGVVIAIDVDGDVVLERKTAAITDLFPIAAFNALVEATAVHRAATQMPGARP